MDSNGSVTLALNATHGTTELFFKPPGLHITYNVLLVCCDNNNRHVQHGIGNDFQRSENDCQEAGWTCHRNGQFFLLPACYFGVAKALSLAPNLALGMVLTGSCPGGCTSNIIAFWTKADICI